MALDGQCLSSQCTAMTRRWGGMCAANVTYPGTLFLQQLIWGAAGSFCSSHPAVCLQVCSLGVGVSLCMQGSTCHECVQFVKSPCLKFYGAALPQPHVTAPTQIKCHLNILAAQVQKGADSKPGIPSVALGVGDSLPLPPPPTFPLCVGN